MSLKSFIKKAGQGIGKAKNVLLPLAGVAVGLAIPGVGGAVGKLLGKGSDALSKAKENGVLGIGDGKPGVLGIGTGKGILKALDGLKGKDGAAGASYSADGEKKGVNPLAIAAGVALGAYLISK